MAQLTFYPDAHPESTSVDGRVDSGILDDSWAVVRGAAGGGSGDTEESVYVQFASLSVQDIWRYIIRVILLFDTSTIPADTVITSAVLEIYGTIKTIDGGVTPAINVFASNPASNVALQNSDYATLGTTPLATEIAYADWDTAGWNTFTLNATGLALINKGGITKLGLRESNYDATGISPTWHTDADTKMEGHSAGMVDVSKSRITRMI